MTESPAYSGVPVWQNDTEVDECPICSSTFNFWFRKHHCRMCGRVVCGNCSPTQEKYLATSYVVAPPSQQFLESPHIPHRTCTECADELRMIRHALSQSPGPRQAANASSSSRGPANATAAPESIPESREFMVQSVIPGADNDYLGRCPVCDKQLFKLPPQMQELHIDNCLKTYSMSPNTANGGPQRKRMLISKIHSKETSTLGDCMICYEDFEPGQSVGRLECLCVFHEKCIFDWFSRKGVGSCPLHNQGE